MTKGLLACLIGISVIRADYFTGNPYHFPLLILLMALVGALFVLLSDRRRIISVTRSETAIVVSGGFVALTVSLNVSTLGGVTAAEVLKPALYVLGFSFMYVLARRVFMSSDTRDLNIWGRRVAFMAMLLVAGDTTIRFLLPTFAVRKAERIDELSRLADRGLSLETIYGFKYGSLMYFDSNYVGIYLILVIAALLGSRIRMSIPRREKVFITTLMILLLLTLSRAAWLAGGVLFFGLIWLRAIVRQNSIGRAGLLTLSAAVGVATLAWGLVSYDVASLFVADASGITKLELFRSFYEGVHRLGSDVLFGLGIERGPMAYVYRGGDFGHLLVSLLVGQLGLVGAVWYFGTLIYFAGQARESGLLLLATLLLLSVSLVDPWEPLIPIVFAYLGEVRSRDIRQRAQGTRLMNHPMLRGP